MKTVIVTFVGGQDLKHLHHSVADRTQDMSPILRLLTYLRSSEQHDWQDVQLLVLEDGPDKDERKAFHAALPFRLAELNFPKDMLCRKDLNIGGPTDWQGLYDEVWRKIPTPSTKGFKRYLFHVTSGTGTMQATLILAATCMSLPRNEVRVFETSKQQDVREIELPYLLGLRARQLRERRATPGKLTAAVRKTLLPNTVVSNWKAQDVYAQLHNIAMSSGDEAPRVLIRGSIGSGKRHAAQQFAQWRCGELIECTTQDELPTATQPRQIILIRWLDAWPKDALQALTQWCDDHRQTCVLATWRTDLAPVVSIKERESFGLRGASQVELPSLASRDDIHELAEALVKSMGGHDGKLFERFQYDYVNDVYPRGLHDLKALLAGNVSFYAPGKHPDVEGDKRARGAMAADEARAVLQRTFEMLSGFHFGGGMPDLKAQMETIKEAVVSIGLGNGYSLDQVTALIGVSQGTVSKHKKSARAGK